MGTFDFASFSYLTPLESLLKSWYFAAFPQGCDRRGGESLPYIFEKMALTPPPEESLADHQRYCSPGGRESFRENFGLQALSAAQVEEEYTALRSFPQFHEAFSANLYRGWRRLSDSAGPASRKDDLRLAYHDRYFPVPPHSHDFFELVILVRGSCRQQVGKDYLDMTTGDLVVVPPGTVHSLMADSDDTILFNMHVGAANFERNFVSLLTAGNILGAFFRQTLYAREDTGSYLLIRTGDHFLGENLLADIYRELYSPSIYRQDTLSALCKLFFIRLLEQFGDKIQTATIARAGDEAIDILSYIQQKNGNVTMEELVDRFSYSSRQIARMITRYTGSTLRDLRKDLRLRQASLLLEQSALPVEEVARKSGYQNPGHFYAEFRERYGKTPLAYRKALERTAI